MANRMSHTAQYLAVHEAEQAIFRDKGLFARPHYSLPMTYSRSTTAVSGLTGQPVSTWSDEWRIEPEPWTL